MIDQSAGDALGHATGEVVRMGSGELIQVDQARAFIHLVPLAVEHTACGDRLRYCGEH